MADNQGVGAMPFRPALPMNRAVFHRLGLSVGIAIALTGCSDDGPMIEQERLAARYPYAVVADTSGCLWRLALKGSFAIPNKQMKPDGTPDCPASAMSGSAQDRATGLGPKGASAVGDSRDAQGPSQ